MNRLTRRLVRQRDGMMAVLRALDDETLDELVRRGRGTVSDGFPASTDAGTLGRPGAEPSSPTEAAALAALTDTPDADPVGRALDAVVAGMHDASRLLVDVDRRRGYVLAAGGERRGRLSHVTACLACGRTVAGTTSDPLRSGYCDACRKAWERAGRPDRPAFERSRRAEQAS